MYNLYSITTNQAAILALFRVVNRYVGKLTAEAGRRPVWRWSGLASARLRNAVKQKSRGVADLQPA